MCTGTGSCSVVLNSTFTWRCCTALTCKTPSFSSNSTSSFGTTSCGLDSAAILHRGGSFTGFSLKFNTLTGTLPSAVLASTLAIRTLLGKLTFYEASTNTWQLTFGGILQRPSKTRSLNGGIVIACFPATFTKPILSLQLSASVCISMLANTRWIFASLNHDYTYPSSSCLQWLWIDP